jgi:hypothetical protein
MKKKMKIVHSEADPQSVDDDVHDLNHSKEDDAADLLQINGVDLNRPALHVEACILSTSASISLITRLLKNSNQDFGLNKERIDGSIAMHH